MVYLRVVVHSGANFLVGTRWRTGFSDLTQQQQLRQYYYHYCYYYMTPHKIDRSSTDCCWSGSIFFRSQCIFDSRLTITIWC